MLIDTVDGHSGVSLAAQRIPLHRPDSASAT